MSEIQNIVKKEAGNIVESNNLYEFSRSLILKSRKLVYQTASFVMVETYWCIGEKIVEEQGGEERSKCGDSIANLSEKLTIEFGKGFDKTNLGKMHQFYLMFQNVETLSWSHYHLLLHVENPKARKVYMNEVQITNVRSKFSGSRQQVHYITI